MTNGVKYTFRLIKRHIRVLPDRVKRGYDVKYTFRLFKRHIRVLPDRVKRGYGAKYTFRLFQRHIRVLLDRVKCGYGVKCSRVFSIYLAMFRPAPDTVTGTNGTNFEL